MTNEATVETKEKWSWSAFWQRLKKREVTGGDLDALFFRVVIPLLLLSVFLVLQLDSEGDAGDWAIRMAYIWVAPPVVVVCCLLSCWAKPLSPNIFGKLYSIVGSTVVGLLLAYASIGYLDLANALTGGDEPVVVSGPIVRKGDTSGRMGPRTYLYVFYEGREIHLQVPISVWKKYKIGDTYSQTMYRGGFGYFYRWNTSQEISGVSPGHETSWADRLGGIKK